MPRVSVIIPVYNAERYLRCCLEAVRRQTLQDIEIICVDDGSTDNSAAILHEYAAKDSRFRLTMLPKNLGAAAARNCGMAIARGEYLGFVDSDDHPALDFYEKLYANAVETNADVGKGNYRYWGLDGRSLPVDYSLNDWIREQKTNFSFAFCSAIYRRQLIVDHSITFPEDQIDIEDPIFSLNVALLCNAITIVEDAEINIRINKDSATFGPPSIDLIFAKFKGLSKIMDILNTHEGLEPQSYAFVTAFWFKSVVMNSLQNKTLQACRVIVSALHTVWRKVICNEQCAVAFAQLQLNELFSALATYRIVELGRYLATFYDSKMFTARELRFRTQNAIRRQASGACTAVPVYTVLPNVSETASLRQCLKVLGGGHPIVFFGPESLDTCFYEDMAREFGVKWAYEKLENAYFESPLTYSMLLLSPDFYSRFIRWEYLLIYQLDCWVFRDELSMWCGKGYDYIGAPWFEGYSEADAASDFVSPSGNGGFSLRKVWSFIECLHMLDAKIIAAPSHIDHVDHIDDALDAEDINGLLANQHEDITVVNVFPRIMPNFAIAPVNEAMLFSFESLPERLYDLTGKLPFGCHGYTKYSPDFWARHIFPAEQKHLG